MHIMLQIRTAKKIVKSYQIHFFASAAPTMGNCFNRGDTVEIGRRSIAIRGMIAEGGFSFVHKAQDLNSKENFALKRILTQTAEVHFVS